MISYTPAVVFGLLRGELVMMRSQQSNLNLLLVKIVETISIMDVKGIQVLRNSTADTILSLVALDLQFCRKIEMA